ncbi:MAG: nucleotidyltransferase domain-containing protein [Planctomycetes bacterium]|nr:nucleotidyltransferase domain-containing protein [Planctomycetota bacterium]
MSSRGIGSRILERLKVSFGRRLRGVLLYGSRARGIATPDSDLDLMVLLEEPVDFGKDLDASIDAIYPLQLEVDYPIHVLPVSAEEFSSQEFGLYRNARREGLFL